MSDEYYCYIIAKPKRFFWFYKLFRLQPYIVDSMFSKEKDPILPKGFAKLKLIGKTTY